MFGGFRPDWRKESPAFIRLEMERRARELEGARLILGIVEREVNNMQMEIADMTDALIAATSDEATDKSDV